MKINLKDLKQITNLILPGELAHKIMSPKMRKSADQIRKEKSDFKESAVLLLIYEKNGELFLPLIQRNTYDGVHSGQISFPGGRFEKEDESLMHTAIRECHEEIGVLCPTHSVIKEMSEIYIPPSNFMVKPYLALYNATPSFTREPKEVEKILEYPIAHLLDDNSLKDTRVFMKKYNSHLKVPALHFEDHIIWGATGVILSELKVLMKEI